MQSVAVAVAAASTNFQLFDCKLNSLIKLLSLPEYPNFHDEILIGFQTWYYLTKMWSLYKTFFPQLNVDLQLES